MSRAFVIALHDIKVGSLLVGCVCSQETSFQVLSRQLQHHNNHPPLIT